MNLKYILELKQDYIQDIINILEDQNSTNNCNLVLVRKLVLVKKNNRT